MRGLAEIKTFYLVRVISLKFHTATPLSITEGHESHKTLKAATEKIRSLIGNLKKKRYQQFDYKESSKERRWFLERKNNLVRIDCVSMITGKNPEEKGNSAMIRIMNPGELIAICLLVKSRVTFSQLNKLKTIIEREFPQITVDLDGSSVTAEVNYRSYLFTIRNGSKASPGFIERTRGSEKLFEPLLFGSSHVEKAMTSQLPPKIVKRIKRAFEAMTSKSP